MQEKSILVILDLTLNWIKESFLSQDLIPICEIAGTKPFSQVYYLYCHMRFHLSKKQKRVKYKACSLSLSLYIYIYIISVGCH